MELGESVCVAACWWVCVCVCVAMCWWVCVCLCGCVLMSVRVFVWLRVDGCACVCVAVCRWVCVCGCMTLNCLSVCLSCKMLLNSIAKIETKYLQCDTEREKLLDLWKGDGSKSFKQVTKSVQTSFFRSWKIVKIFLRTSLSFFHNFFAGEPFIVTGLKTSNLSLIT